MILSSAENIHDLHAHLCGPAYSLIMQVYVTLVRQHKVVFMLNILAKRKRNFVARLNMLHNPVGVN